MATQRHIQLAKQGQNEWSVTVWDACFEQPGTCLIGCILPCFPLYRHRMILLEQDINRYQCCQGFHGLSCDCRSCTDPCPSFCLCMETCCCSGPAVVTNRIMLETRFSLRMDWCDYSIFGVSLVCSCLGAIFQNDSCKTTGDLLWCLGMGMFNAQHENEIKVRGLDHPAAGGTGYQAAPAIAPPVYTMDGPPSYASAAPAPASATYEGYNAPGPYSAPTAYQQVPPKAAMY